MNCRTDSKENSVGPDIVFFLSFIC
uniref:Uncharacterized protein n=1 Tax=Lepeophtheirus salmonis TaxID=72036 RepID=A0A0K2VF42_LEPSM